MRYKNTIKKIKYLSGPISFYYITPKNKESPLPLVLLMGDRHGSEKKDGQEHTCNFECNEKVDCIAKDKDECCFSLSNPNFLNVLSEQTDLSYPIDIYTEHWSHEHDKKDTEITYYGSELEKIEKTLKKYIGKSEKKKNITLNGKDIKLLRVKNSVRKEGKICQVCDKSIDKKDKFYYMCEGSDAYHIKCTLNIRWQSADVRRSFSRKSIENDLSNIYWEFDNPRYKLKQYHIYLLMCLMKVNGANVINAINTHYDKNKTYVFPEISSRNLYEMDINNFAEGFFNLIMSEDCPRFSVMHKEIVRSVMNDPAMWKRIYIRSYYETYDKRAFHDPHLNLLFFKMIYKKIYSPKKINEVVDVLFMTFIHAISPFLDIYALLRMFSLTKKKKSVLNIFYTGGMHILNILHLLTTKDTLYPHYSIDFYSKKDVDFYRKEDQRCLSIKYIDLYKDISERRKQFEKMDKIR